MSQLHHSQVIEMGSEVGVAPVGLQWLDLRSAMIYHLTYHSTRSLHINHLIFLHGYMLAVFVACACASRPGSVASAVAVGVPASIVVAYSELLGGKIVARIPAASGILLCGFQPLITICLAAAAWWIAGYPLAGVSRVVLGASALGVSVGCLIAQVIGHKLNEPVMASPNLFHGFIAAVVLEWFSLVIRLGGASAIGLDGVWAEAARVRAILEHELSVMKQQRAQQHCPLVDTDRPT